MNQCKLDMAKQEIARLNIDILKHLWTKMDGMGKFNSDDHYIYDYGQKSIRKNGVALIVNKIIRKAAHGWNLKNDRTKY